MSALGLSARDVLVAPSPELGVLRDVRLERFVGGLTGKRVGWPCHTQADER